MFSVYISFLASVSYFKQIHLHETYENNASFKRNGDMWKLQDMASQPGHMRYFNAVWKKDAETMPAMHDLRNKHIPYLLWLQDQNVHKNNDAITITHTNLCLCFLFNTLLHHCMHPGKCVLMYNWKQQIYNLARRDVTSKTIPLPSLSCISHVQYPISISK